MKAKRSIGMLTLSALCAVCMTAGILTGCSGESHDLVYIEGKAATCTEAGSQAYYMCADCDKIFSDENGENEVAMADIAIAPLGHDMHHHDAATATCTQPGNVEYWTCSREEGVYYADEAGTQTLDEIGVTVSHDMTYHPQVDPTAEADGTAAYYECGSCHQKFADEWGDRVLTDADLVIDKIDETIDGVLTADFYTQADAFVIGAENVQSGGVGIVANASLREKGIYLHIVVNHNVSADEQQGDHGKVALYMNFRNEENYNLPGGAWDCSQQSVLMELRLSGTIGWHDVALYQYYNIKDNGAEAASRYTTTWEFYMPYSEFARANNSVVADAFETNEDGDTVLKTGYNAMMTIVGNMAGTDTFESNGTSVCMSQDSGAWQMWSKQGYADSGADQKYMIVTESGFADTFTNITKTYNVVVGEYEHASLTFPETIAADGTLSGTVDASLMDDGYMLLGLTVNGTFFPSTDGENGARIYSVSIPDVTEWNSTEVAVQPVIVGNKSFAVTISVKLFGLDGAEITDTAAIDRALNGKVTLTSTYDEKTELSVTDGRIGVDPLYAGEYSVGAYGYLGDTFVVSDEGDITVEFYQTIAYPGNEKVTVNNSAGTVAIGAQNLLNNAWTGSAELVLPEGYASAENAIFETTLKMANTTTELWGGGSDQRWAIRMTEGNGGFYFWSWFDGVGKTYIRQFGENNLTDAMAENTAVNSDEVGNGWMYTALTGESGLQIRIVRTGTTLTLYANNGTEWVNLGSVTCGADDALEIVLYGVRASYTFSEFAFTDMGESVAYKAPTPTAPGNVAYYTDGMNYWLPNGEKTTLEAVTIARLVEHNVTLNVTFYDITGTQVTDTDELAAIYTALNGKISVSGDYGYSETDLSIASGTISVSEIYEGEYTLSAEGYGDVVITVGAGSTVPVSLYADRATASNDMVSVDGDAVTIASQAMQNNAWTGSAELVLPEGAEDAQNVTLEMTVKIAGLNPGDFWGWTANQRWAIKMTDGNAGFYLWSWTSDGVDKSHIRQFSEECISNATKENDDVNADEPGIGWMYTAMAGEGLQVRVVRDGTTLTMYANNGTEWVNLGSVTCGAEDKLDIVLYGVTAEWTFSDISVTVGAE